MAVTINGTTGITTPEVALDNSAADGGQVVLKSSGYGTWNLDNYSGRLRGYYNSTEYFTVDASGNMGVGTSSPAAKLDIATNTQVSARFGTTANDVGVGISLLGASTQKTWNIASNAFTAGALQFSRSTAVGGTTYTTADVTIDSSGNLLVGGTTSGGTGTLSVVNNSQGLGASPYLNFNKSGSGGVVAVYFQYAGSTKGSISYSDTATSYNTSSDYRLKENIAPMTGALAKVAQLNPVTYNWKSDGSASEGFIAHELQAVVPDCVTGEKDAVDADGNPAYQGIDTSFLVATLTAAIQELKTELDSVKAELAALKGQP